MKDFEIESLADQILESYQQQAPVDLIYIANQEGIELLEGDYGDDFHGRLEFLSDMGKFALFHPRLATARFSGRIRFSIAHELGHYFIEEHREGIIRGIFHNAEQGFISNNPIEREADKFAAALLIPNQLLRATTGRRGILTLNQILSLAQKCNASAQATAFRYVRFAEEPCLAIISKEGNILYSFASDEANARGFGLLGNRQVPPLSVTYKASQGNVQNIVEGETNTTLWFSERRGYEELWEEAIPLGSTFFVLTLLSWKDYTAED